MSDLRILGRQATLELVLLSVCAAQLFTLNHVMAQARRSKTEQGKPISWATSCIPIYLNSEGRTRLESAEVERVVRRSLTTWSDPSCAELSLVFEGRSTHVELGYVPELGLDNQNLIIFLSALNGDTWTWPYDPNALALTTVTFCENDTPSCPEGTIVDTDIEINEVLYPFSTGDSGPLNDLENTLTHELGHLIGFDHNPQADSTMFAITTPGERSKRDLSSVDVSGLCSAYGLERCLACDLSTYDITRNTEYDERLTCDEGSLTSAQSDSGCQQRSASATRSELTLLVGILLALLRLTQKAKA